MSINLLDYNQFPIYAIIALFLGAFIIVVAGKSKFVQKSVALLAVTLCLGFICALIKPVMIDGQIITYWLGGRAVAGGYAIGIALEVDGLGLFFGLLLGIAAFVACVYSIQYMEHDEHVGQYYTLFLMLSGGVLGMVFTGDIFNMFIMVEILTFAAVALTAFRSRSEGALEAAFKYLVVGTIGSTFILTGVVMLYAQAHTLNIAQLASIIPTVDNTTVKVAFALLFVGFSTKAFIVPFHPLAADAHGAAPASVSVMISGVLTKSGLYAIIRLTYFVFGLMQLPKMQFLLTFIGTVSMFVCVTMALAQHDFKRLLAFHSISQIGYVLTAVGLCTGLGISAGLYHAMNHTIFKGLLFLSAGAVMHAAGTGDLNKLGGLSKKMPHTTVLFLIGAASISGIPPFNGFASKWMVYQATYQKAVESGNIGFLFVTIVALITSTLTLASFVKVAQSVFFGKLPKECENVKEVPFGMRLAMGIFALMCIVSGLFPGLVTKYITEPAAKAVFAAAAYIGAAGFSGGANNAVSFASVGAWDPINWLIILFIALLSVTIVAISCKYDAVSESEDNTDTKHMLFFGGEEAWHAQVGGDDMFWGFKYNWRHYFDFMHNLHSGVVNDYALWAVVDAAIILLFTVIVL